MYQFKMMLALKKLQDRFKQRKSQENALADWLWNLNSVTQKRADVHQVCQQKDLFRWQLISKDFYPCFDL